MSDANSEVARAIRDALTSLGLVSAGSAAALEKSIRDGTIKAEDWYRVIETSLPGQGGSTDAEQAK